MGQRVLVFGAGVLGCVLASELNRAGCEVTLLARGDWKRAIDERGLTIRHYLQRKTTLDRISTIDKLMPDDVYDFVFVVMQWTQLASILPQIAANHSKFAVFVGNNMDAAATLRQVGSAGKEIAFGFLAAGGRRENGRVISVHLRLSMTVGGLSGAMSASMRSALDELFQGTGYRLKHQSNMDAWLKCHMAFILPACGVIYKYDGRLPKATRADVEQIIDASLEAYALLARLGYPIAPEGSDTSMTRQRKRFGALLWIAFKTRIGRLAASDHAMGAVSEMLALNRAFAALRQATDVPMPAWDALQVYMERKQEASLSNAMMRRSS